MRGVTKRRLMLGVAGLLMSLMIAGPVAAGGTDHGRTDVNDVTTGAHGGLIEGSDGGERNLNSTALAPNAGVNPSILNVNGTGTGLQGAFQYEEALEFNSGINAGLRTSYYDEKYPEPKQGTGG